MLTSIKGLAVIALTTMVSLSQAGQWVELQDDKLSTRFSNTPLSSGLKDLSQATGIEFLLDENLTGTLDANVKNVPSQVAVRRLLSSFNHVMFYRADAGGKPVVSKVKLFRPGAENSASYQLIGGANKLVGSKGAGSASAVNAAEDDAVASAGSAAGASEVAADAQQGSKLAAQAGNAYRDVAAKQRQLSMLTRKLQGTERALSAEMAKLRQSLSSGSDNPQADLAKMVELESQLTKSKQSNSQQLLAKQQELQQAVAVLKSVQTPAQQQQDYQVLLERTSRGDDSNVALSSSSGDRYKSRRNRREI